MPADVIGGDGRSGENELTYLFTSVHLCPHVVPYIGPIELPLVDQLRRHAIQHNGWIYLECYSGGFISIQVDETLGELLGRERFARRLRPF